MNNDAILTELTHTATEATYRRVLIFTFSKACRPQIEHEHYPTIAAKTVRLVFERDGEHEPWYLHDATIRGSRIKANGMAGLTDARIYCAIDGENHALLDGPTWLQELVVGALSDLERERTTTPATQLPPIIPYIPRGRSVDPDGQLAIDTLRQSGTQRGMDLANEIERGRNRHHRTGDA